MLWAWHAPSQPTKQSTVTKLLDFVRPRHHAILATVRSDGTSQMSPNTMGVDDSGSACNFDLSASSQGSQASVSNPQVSVCVLSDDFGGEWVQIYGTARRSRPPPTSVEPLVEYFRNIAGEHSGLGRVPERQW